MTRKSMILVLLVFPTMLFAQRTREVSGEYTYYGPWTISPKEAEDKAIEEAKIQAIADAFGTLVDMHSASLIQNEDGKSSSSFFSLGESSVKGEWLADKKAPETSVWIEQKDKFIVARAKVWGEAREICSAPVDINALLQRQTDGKHDEDHFHHGDNIYLSFKSPSKGYLAVYLIDGKGNPYCMLPYAEDEDGQFPVEANKSYLLFSEKHSKGGEKCEEYSMLCEKEMDEQNIVYIIFSPNKFTKANDEESNEVVDVKGKLEQKPRALSNENFQKWLLRCRRADKDMQVIIRPVVVMRD